LSPLIYLETNWLIGAVVGQDPHAERLLSLSQAEVQLAIPSACLMEAISAFDWKRIERNRLKDELDRQLAQVRRSEQILVARQLTAELIQANLTNAQLLNELFRRLDDLLLRVSKRAEMIPATFETVEHMVQLQRETELGRADALILACILSDSKHPPSEKRAFLSGNIRDFDVEPVKNLLEQSGIKFFGSSDHVLKWLAGERARLD